MREFIRAVVTGLIAMGLTHLRAELESQRRKVNNMLITKFGTPWGQGATK